MTSLDAQSAMELLLNNPTCPNNMQAIIAMYGQSEDPDVQGVVANANDNLHQILASAKPAFIFGTPKPVLN